MPLSKESRAALDRMDEIGHCFKALGDLMVPGAELHAVNRDSLACILSFLTREHAAARNALVLTTQ